MPPHLQSLLGTSWIMSHRALPIHELLVFMRAMSHSLMALDASSFWCFWRRRADECFEASQVNAKLRALQKWQLQHVPTLDSRNRSHCLLMLCIIHRHRHFNSKGLKREVADAGTRLCATFVVPLQRGEMRWVVVFSTAWSMLNGLYLLRHAKTRFAISELFLKMSYFSVLT